MDQTPMPPRARPAARVLPMLMSPLRRRIRLAAVSATKPPMTETRYDKAT
jgi:hypothetical protein